ncbi:hypothetical protein JCM5353_000937 [Sporobolomyces roseus]
MPQHLRRAKQAKAKLKNRLSLHSLPPNVLEIIFLETPWPGCITKRNYLITKVLLRYTLGALHRHVYLFSRAQASRFYASLSHRPWLGPHVEVVTYSEELDERESKLLSVEDKSLIKYGETAIEAEIKELESPPQPYDPSLHNCGRAKFLRRLFRRLPNIGTLFLYGKWPSRVIFEPSFVNSTNVFTHLHTVHIDCRKEAFEDDIDQRLCDRLKELPALQDLGILNQGAGSPWQDPVYVQPQPTKWNLVHFRFNDAYTLEHGTWSLFRSFTNAFKHLQLHCRYVQSDFNVALEVVPVSLEILELQIGPGACEHEPNTQFFPCLDHVLKRFTNLADLILDGPLFTPAIYSTLSQLHKLVYLSIGYNIPLPATELIRLVSDPDIYPDLKEFKIFLCHCPEPGVDIRVPKWTQTFRWKDAAKIVRIAEKRGIKVGGNIKCATATCNRKDGHECSRNINWRKGGTGGEELGK